MVSIINSFLFFKRRWFRSSGWRCQVDLYLVQHSPELGRSEGWGGWGMGAGGGGCLGSHGEWEPASGKGSPFLRSTRVQLDVSWETEAMGKSGRCSWACSPFGNFLYSPSDNSLIKMRQSVSKQSLRDHLRVSSPYQLYSFSGVVTSKNEIEIETNIGGSQESMRFLEKIGF